MVKEIDLNRGLTVSLDSVTTGRLSSLAHENGVGPEEFAETLLEEGLRMAAHPGIVFRPGPVGRRPALACGPDVWEIARVLRAYLPDAERAIQQSARLMGLHPSDTEVALNYYQDYRSEVDEWLRRLDEEAEELERAWRLERGLPVP